MKNPRTTPGGQPPMGSLLLRESDAKRRAGDLADARSGYREAILSARRSRDQRVTEVAMPVEARGRRLRRNLALVLCGCAAALLISGGVLWWRRPVPPREVDGSHPAILRWAAGRQMWRLLKSMTTRDWEAILDEVSGSPGGASGRAQVPFEEQIALFRNRFLDETQRESLGAAGGGARSGHDDRDRGASSGGDIFKCSIDRATCPAGARPTEDGPIREELIDRIWVGVPLVEHDCDSYAGLVERVGRTHSWRRSEAYYKSRLHREIAECYRERESWDRMVQQARLSICSDDDAAVRAYATLYKDAHRRQDRAAMELAAQCASEAAEYRYRMNSATWNDYGRLRSGVGSLLIASSLHFRNRNIAAGRRLMLDAKSRLDRILPEQLTSDVDRVVYHQYLRSVHTGLAGLGVIDMDPAEQVLGSLAAVRRDPLVADTELMMLDGVEAMWRMRRRDLPRALPILRACIDRYRSLAEWDDWFFIEIQAGVEQDRRPTMAEINRHVLVVADALTGKRTPRKQADLEGVLAWLTAKVQQGGAP